MVNEYSLPDPLAIQMAQLFVCWCPFTYTISPVKYILSNARMQSRPPLRRLPLVPTCQRTHGNLSPSFFLGAAAGFERIGLGMPITTVAVDLIQPPVGVMPVAAHLIRAFPGLPTWREGQTNGSGQ
jgi:hypothetical protein